MRDALGLGGPLPEQGTDAGPLLEQTARLLFDHSLFNGHPRFFGYITAPPAPIGMLGELLASAVNPNVGAWTLSPAATEIESQTVRWIAELIGYPADCGGLLVSGGNMANVVCFLAARAAEGAVERPRAGRRRRRRPRSFACTLGGNAHLDSEGRRPLRPRHRVDPLDPDRRRSADGRRRAAPAIDADVAAGDVPFIVVGTAGSVSTGAVDPLPEIAASAGRTGSGSTWTARTAASRPPFPRRRPTCAGLREADSIAVDPHKWLYAPLEAGCALVRDPEALRAAFAYHPPYYHFDERAINFVDYGPQNSRGFRALKVWLALRQVGRRRLPPDDRGRHRLSRAMARRRRRHPELQLVTQAAEHHDVPLCARRSARAVGDAGVERTSTC